MCRTSVNKLNSLLCSGLFGFTACLLAFLLLYFITKDIPRSGPTPEQIEAYAKLFLEQGIKERVGRRVDCSGYTQEVFYIFAIRLPPSASEQFRVTNRLEKEDLSKGDLVFFKTNGHSISHVGIYLDSSKFIHSPGKRKNVRIDNLENKYWQKTFVCGGKIPLHLQAINKSNKH